MPEIITGCIHIHSNYSDGTRSIEDIAGIADEVGLDFLIFTDHMTLQGLKDGKEGYYGKTLALVGYEINDRNNKNHYLAIGLDEALPEGLTAAEYVRQTAEKGGIGIIAHPDEIRSHLPKYPSYPWTEWGVSEYDGIEIWNHMSEWMEGLTRYNQLVMAVNPRKYLKQPTDRILSLWDTVNMERKVAGIGSIDAHGYPYKLGPFKLVIFPYKVQFKSIRTHLILDRPLSKNAPEAREQIFKAIKQCNIFISNYRRGDASEFYVDIVEEGKVVGIGQEAVYEEGAVMNIRLPKPGEVIIIKDGATYCNFRGESGTIPVSGPGLYRVEVYRFRKGWIYTNHIRLI